MSANSPISSFKTACKKLIKKALSSSSAKSSLKMTSLFAGMNVYAAWFHGFIIAKKAGGAKQQ